MKITEWHKSISMSYPELLDKTSSDKYVIVRRNVIEKSDGVTTEYEYDEKMIPRADWNVYEDVLTVTPYTDSKTAYIDDTEVRFTDVPSGNLSVFVVGDDYPNYSVMRDDDRITVSFTEPLKYVAEITIQVS